MTRRLTALTLTPVRAALAVVATSSALLGLGTGQASALGVTAYVAVGGSDTGNCQSASSPCATISYAVSQASPGGTINVGPGTFKTSLGLTEQGFYTIVGSTLGTAPVTVIEPASPGGTIFAADRSGFTLQDLTLNGEAGTAVSGGYGSTITLVDSTVTNSAVAACGCGPTAQVTVTDSTISGNTVGIDIAVGSANASITASTIANNGTGVESVIYGVSVAATVLAHNTSGDCSFQNGTATDNGYNLDADGTCGFSAANHSQSGVDPKLGPLQNNGGPTETQSPGIGSPVLNQIPPGTSTVCPSTDQRGVARPQGGGCDIGAVELSVASIKAITSANAVTATDGTPFSFTVTTIGTPTPVLSETGALPKGLSFANNRNGTATISGTPSSKTHGIKHLTITARYGAGATKYVITQALSLTVAKG